MMMVDAVSQTESQHAADRQRLIGLLGWIAAHPRVADLDEASERVLNVLDRFSGHADAPAIAARSIEPITDLLNQLLDTIGNCETEERNLKLALWSDIVLRAAAARDFLQADR